MTSGPVRDDLIEVFSSLKRRRRFANDSGDAMIFPIAQMTRLSPFDEELGRRNDQSNEVPGM